MKKISFLILFAVVFLFSCTKTEVSELQNNSKTIEVTPTVISKVSSTPENVSSITDTPTFAPTSTPTQTPPLPPTIVAETATPIPPATSTQESAMFVAAGTQIPTSNLVIDSGNVEQLTEVAHWGRGAINDIDLSMDGQKIAVATGTGVYIHDFSDLSEPTHIIRSAGNVVSVSLDADNEFVAIAIQGEGLQIWQMSPLQQIYESGQMAREVKFSPITDVLAFSTGENVALLDLARQEIIHTFPSKIGFSFSKHESEIAIWEYGKVQLYDWNNDAIVSEVAPVSHLESEYQGTEVIANDVFIANESELVILAPQVFPNGFTGPVEVQTGEDASLLFAIEGAVRLSNATKYVCNEPVFYWDPPQPAVPWKIELTPDEQYAGLLYQDNGFSDDYHEYASLDFYNVNTGEKQYSVKEGLIDFEISSDGNTWVAGFQDGRIEIRRTNDGSIIDSFDGYESPILKIKVSKDNQWVAVIYLDDVKVYRRKDGLLSYKYSMATDIAFDPEGYRFAVAYEDGTIELRKVENGNLISAISGHRERVTSVQFSSKERLLSTGFDCNMIMWQVPNMSQIDTFENVMVEGDYSGNLVPMRIKDFIELPDQQSVVGLFFGYEFGIWSLLSGKIIRSPSWESYGTILAISSDGEYVAVTDNNFSEPWDESIMFLPIETNIADFSPTENILISSQWNYDSGSTLQFWKVPTMELLHTTYPFDRELLDVTFTHDGQQIVTGGVTGIVRVWGLP